MTEQTADAPPVAPVSLWSSRKAWVMGIVATLAGSAIAGMWTQWYHPTVSDRERTAVFSLVQDIKAHPVYLTAIYQLPHAFIDERWRKPRATDSYYESAESRADLFILGNAAWRHGDALALLDPKYGRTPGAVQVTDLDTVMKDGKSETHVTAALPASEPDPATEAPASPGASSKGRAELDLHATQLYLMQPTPLPAEVLRHADDLDVPSDIRQALLPLKAAVADAMSFGKALKPGEDLVLLGFATRPPGDAAARRLDERTALYPAGPTVDVLEQVYEVTHAIQQWADHYSIDLGEQSEGFYDRAYAGGQQH
jgi:hypothetical protein